jgi:ketosteroid isomerase-like protein
MKLLLIICAFAALAFGQQQPAIRSSQTDEVAIRAADEAWTKAIAKKSIEETVSFYDSEAMTAGSAMPPAKGISAIRNMWKQLLSDPGFALTWKVDKVVVTESRTIGYSTGTWHIGTDSGPYFAVWRKQPDGKWRLLMDAAWYSGK